MGREHDAPTTKERESDGIPPSRPPIIIHPDPDGNHVYLCFVDAEGVHHTPESIDTYDPAKINHSLCDDVIVEFKAAVEINAEVMLFDINKVTVDFAAHNKRLTIERQGQGVLTTYNGDVLGKGTVNGYKLRSDFAGRMSSVKTQLVINGTPVSITPLYIKLQTASVD